MLGRRGPCCVCSIGWLQYGQGKPMAFAKIWRTGIPENGVGKKKAAPKGGQVREETPREGPSDMQEE